VKIWLPDDTVPITVDTSDDNDDRCTTYARRFQMTLQPIAPPNGFAKEKEEE